MTSANYQSYGQYGHTVRKAIAPFIPESAQRLLDVGCHTGGFGEGLKSLREVEIWGVEPNVEAASYASLLLNKVLCEPFDSTTTVPDNYFDVVVFNDVLEHLVDPWSALMLAKKKLRPGGCIVASIPNFLHKENLLHILLDRNFEYQNAGIRDKTHLRFFTKKSAQQLFIDCGCRVEKSVGVNEDWWSPSLLSRMAYRLFSTQLQETKFIQYVVVAKPEQDL
jgi:2-polyprenyl-3-methyl-5-hydroxy-6-metoxy-1,4-benzoquinol methylase